MSLIFLSHSSVDELEAIALKQWLLDNGWDDVFLDLDPIRGLTAGERWQEARVKRGEDFAVARASCSRSKSVKTGEKIRNYPRNAVSIYSGSSYLLNANRDGKLKLFPISEQFIFL
jgi:hypothetical protein